MFRKKIMIVAASSLLFFNLNGCTHLAVNQDQHLVCTAGKNQHRNDEEDPATYKVFGKTYAVMETSSHYEEKGRASWYGRGFHHKRTYSGERYNMYKLTAAHKTLPLHTQVEVTNLLNGKKVIVTINDRGPFVRNRLIDLSYAAAKQLQMLGHGTIPVNVKAICTA